MIRSFRLTDMTFSQSPAPFAKAAPARVKPARLESARLPFAVALYFLMIALPIQFNLGTVFMTGVRAVLLITTVPIALRLFSGQLGRVLPTDVLLLIYSVWSLVTLYINSPSQAVSYGGSYVLEVFGSYLLARNFIRTPEQFRAMCRGLFAVLIFSLPFAIYETQTGRAPIPIFIGKLPGIFSYGDYYGFLSGRRLGLERAQAIFSHPIHYGVFCASLTALAFVAFKGLMGTSRRLVLTALVCVGVICSVSSGAILPMILQFGLIFWAWIFNRVQARWIILCSLFAFFYAVVDIISNRTAIEVFLEYGTLSPQTADARKQIFEWGMVNVWKNPFFGIGLNDWERAFWLSSSMDNFWLLSTVRYGIPGFLLLITSYLLVVRAAVWRDFGDSGVIWQFRRAWVFTQVGMVLTLCTVDIWDTALSFVFFLLGAGAWLVSVPADTGSDPTKSAVVIPDSRYTRFSWRPGRQQPAAALPFVRRG